MRAFEFPLSPRWKAIAFVAVSVLVSCFIAGESLRVGVAAIFARSFDLVHIERAVRLDPTNPALHRRLGSYYLDSADEIAPRKAEREFRLATKLSPLEAAGWTGLAQACEAASDQDCADHSFAHALTLSPMAPRFYWQAGLNFAVTSRPREAVPYFRRLLALAPDYATSVFRLCPWSLEDPDFMLNHVLPRPANATVTLDYINFLSAHDKNGPAGTVWSSFVAGHPQFPLSSVAPFVESLLGLNQTREAVDVWHDLEHLGIVPHPLSATRNIVFNGSFEHAPLNLGFDWRLQPSSDLFIIREGEDVHDGKHALRVDFTVPANHDSEPVYQLVPIEPDQRYRLAAYVRSDSITSGSGPRLKVSDPFCELCLDEVTPSVTGSSEWHQLVLNFSTGADTRLVRISVWRPRSRSFPFEITGTFWLDDVSLTRIAS
jgi:hypothetical protein